VKKSVLLGMMEEIRMKASILRKRLRESPDQFEDIVKKTQVLEEEMLICLAELATESEK
jgi:hypothetical protein